MEKKKLNAVRGVQRLDTTTRYEVNGRLVITPEDYEEGHLVADRPLYYRADVSLGKNGHAVITPVSVDRQSSRLFEVLYQVEHGGTGARWHQNQEFQVLRIRVPRHLPLAGRIKLVKEAFLDAMAWMRENGVNEVVELRA